MNKPSENHIGRSKEISMKTQLILASTVVSLAALLPGYAGAQNTLEGEIKSHIAVSWNASIQELAPRLAERLVMPFVDKSTGSDVNVNVQQSDDLTVEHAIESINAQIASSNLVLEIRQLDNQEQLILSNKQAIENRTVKNVVVPGNSSEFENKTIDSLNTTPSADAAKHIPATPSFAVLSVTPNDKTIRDVLQRWSKQSGWTHEQEHWQVARDLPVRGSENYEIDFRSAVRALLDTSRMTDMPVQPCFHSNKVMRVVAEAELCNKR